MTAVDALLLLWLVGFVWSVTYVGRTLSRWLHRTAGSKRRP